MGRSGAEIERGVIVAETEDGYCVKSYTRPGIISPPMKSTAEDVGVGTMVYFFLFPDGDGCIIGKM